MEAHEYTIFECAVGFAVHVVCISRRERNRGFAVDVGGPVFTFRDALRAVDMPLNPIQSGLVLAREARDTGAAIDIAHAVAEADHVGDDYAATTFRAIADIDVAIFTGVEVVGAKVDEAVANAAMIDLHLGDSTGVFDAVK